MRLTSFTDYGLRALMRLAGEPERSFDTNELAADLAISRHHLSKIVGVLANGGIVATRRGVGGGFRLARPPEEITIGAVVRLLEAPTSLVECFREDGGACLLTPGCRLKGRLQAAREAFLDELDRSTLAECAYRLPTRSLSQTFEA